LNLKPVLADSSPDQKTMLSSRSDSTSAPVIDHLWLRVKVKLKSIRGFRAEAPTIFSAPLEFFSSS